MEEVGETTPSEGGSGRTTQKGDGEKRDERQYNPKETEEGSITPMKSVPALDRSFFFSDSFGSRPFWALLGNLSLHWRDFLSALELFAPGPSRLSPA